jgi:tyrosinase
MHGKGLLLFVALLPTGSLATCALTDTNVAACNAGSPPASQRVRRELRTLSVAEFQKYADAIWTMKNTDMATGQGQYGSQFKTYDYFVVKHAVTAMDSRGDQGHFSNAFATWHSAFILEFEEALLAVDPSIGAMPYWDGTGDIMTADYFGTAMGNGADNVVADGKFANFPVTTSFNMADWNAYVKTDVAGASNPYGGSASGALRGSSPANPLTTAFVTRYGRAWSFATSAQDDCVSSSACWNDWYNCVEGGSSSGNFHSGAHQSLGGKSGSNRADFEDPTTSPNDPVFWVHHANVDRNRMNWMIAHKDSLSNYYGFGPQCFGPLLNSGCPTDSIELQDVAGALWPFSGSDLAISKTTDAVTHADILCYLGPDSAPYRYDDYAGAGDGSSVPSPGATSPSDNTDTTVAPSPPASSSASLSAYAAIPKGLVVGILSWSAGRASM